MVNTDKVSTESKQNRNQDSRSFDVVDVESLVLTTNKLGDDFSDSVPILRGLGIGVKREVDDQGHDCGDCERWAKV